MPDEFTHQRETSWALKGKLVMDPLHSGSALPYKKELLVENSEKNP